MRNAILWLLVIPAAAVYAGDPIPGVDVDLGKNPGGSVVVAKTDAQGKYVFDKLEPGTYVLRFGGLPAKAGARGAIVRSKSNITNNREAGTDRYTVDIEVSSKEILPGPDPGTKITIGEPGPGRISGTVTESDDSGQQGGNVSTLPLTVSARVKGEAGQVARAMVGIQSTLKGMDAVEAVKVDGDTVTVTIGPGKTLWLTSLEKAVAGAGAKGQIELMRDDIMLVGTVEVVIPACDAGSKDAAYMALKALPGVDKVDAGTTRREKEANSAMSMVGTTRLAFKPTKGATIREVAKALSDKIKGATIDDIAWTAPKADAGGAPRHR